MFMYSWTGIDTHLITFQAIASNFCIISKLSIAPLPFTALNVVGTSVLGLGGGQLVRWPKPQTFQLLNIC